MLLLVFNFECNGEMNLMENYFSPDSLILMPTVPADSSMSVILLLGNIHPGHCLII